MALPAAGQPISFKDINDELSNSSQAELDLKAASIAFTSDGGASVAAAPFGMDELAGLSDLAVVQRTIEDFYLYERDSDQEDILAIRGWADDELIECVEDTSTAPTGGGVSISGLSGTFTQDSISSGASHINTLNLEVPGGFVDGRVVRANGNQTIGDVTFSDEATLNGGGRIFRNNAESKIHEVAADGTISNTIAYKPGNLVISLVSKNSNSVTVRATGDTRVAKTLRFYKDSTEVTKTNHTKGAVGNGSVTADQAFGSLAQGTSFAFKVRGENGSSASPGNDSNTINVITDGITFSATALADDSTSNPETVVISTILTVGPFTGGSGTPKIKVNNASNTRYRQATTSSGLSSASFTTPTTGASGQTLTLDGSGQVFIEFEITEATGVATTKSYTFFDSSLSRSINVSVTAR